MTAKEAAALGYSVEPASLCEVGLIHNGRGVRTWWFNDFDRKIPELDHPRIMEAIEINERMLWGEK